MEFKTLFRLFCLLIFSQLLSTSLGDDSFAILLRPGLVQGGRPAKQDEIPYIVGILTANGIHGYCGGAILQPKFIISAAHCFVDANGHQAPATSLSVVAGVLGWNDDGKQVTGVKKITINKDYKSKTFENDIAILELLMPLQLGKGVQAISVSAGGTQSAGMVTISGWGQMRKKPHCDGPIAMSPVLRKADVFHVPRAECNELRQQGNSPSHISQCPWSGGGVHPLSETKTCILATHPRTDTCIGENGGLLVCSRRTNGQIDRHLCGIGSTGCGCGEGRPGCYTDVTYMHDWIERIVRNNEDQVH